jgi:multidrug resistance efflux pump
MVGMLILLLVFAKWVAIPLALPRTNEACSNALLTVVRADNEGYPELRLDVGQAVKQFDPVAVLSNADRDPSRIARLKVEMATTRAEQGKRRRDLQVAKDLEQLAKQELEQYRRTLVAGLKASLQETEAKIKELTVKHQQSKRIVDICRRLGSSAAISRDEADRATETEAMSGNALEQAEASRRRIVIELEAAERNIFVQRESPIYLTWHLQMRLSIPQLETQLAETDERLAALEAHLQQIQVHDHRLAGSTVYSPVAGVVWHRNASSGPVTKGEWLVEIAQTQRQFVEALFPESHARSFYPGARAVIVFSGLPPFEGTVRAVRQPSPTDHDLACAIRLPRQLNQLTVLIDFKRPPTDASLLGRQCQVLVADRSNPAHGWAAKLFCLLRW